MTSEFEGKDLVELEGGVDALKMEYFWKQKGISGLRSLPPGKMAYTWSGSLRGAREVVCQFGPKLDRYAAEYPDWRNLNGFLHPDKYKTSKIVTEAVRGNGVPAPEIIDAGFDEKLYRSWCIMTVVPGINLEKDWQEMSMDAKHQFLYDLGTTLGRLHATPNPVDIQREAVPDWHEKWYQNLMTRLVKLGLYTTQELLEIKERVLTPYLNRHSPPAITLTHGDILAKNIMIHADKKKISSLIDWETSGPGDPWHEAVLAAWWMSDEDESNYELFRQLIKGYSNQAPAELKLTSEQAKEMTPFADILWYLNVLWHREIMGDRSQTKRRMKAIYKILQEIR